MNSFHRKNLLKRGIVVLVVFLLFQECRAQTKDDASPRRPLSKKYMVYAPSRYEKLDILINKHRQYKYYLFSPEKPLEVDIQGPTTLKVMVRLLYNLEMKGAQNFGIRILEPRLMGLKKEIAYLQFTTKKSRASHLDQEAEVVPSKGLSFSWTIPTGQHHFLLELKSSTAHQAALRLLILKKDVHSWPKEKMEQ